jgi:hypothetical protein
VAKHSAGSEQHKRLLFVHTGLPPQTSPPPPGTQSAEMGEGRETAEMKITKMVPYTLTKLSTSSSLAPRWAR